MTINKVRDKHVQMLEFTFKKLFLHMANYILQFQE